MIHEDKHMHMCVPYFLYFSFSSTKGGGWQNVNEMVITPTFIKLSWRDLNSLMNMHANLLIKLIILLKIHLSSKDFLAMILTCFHH